MAGVITIRAEDGSFSVRCLECGRVKIYRRGETDCMKCGRDLDLPPLLPTREAAMKGEPKETAWPLDVAQEYTEGADEPPSRLAVLGLLSTIKSRDARIAELEVERNEAMGIAAQNAAERDAAVRRAEVAEEELGDLPGMASPLAEACVRAAIERHREQARREERERLAGELAEALPGYMEGALASIDQLRARLAEAEATIERLREAGAPILELARRDYDSGGDGWAHDTAMGFIAAFADALDAIRSRGEE